MDFKLSEQQTAFRDLMRDFARQSISPVAREWELAGRYPSEIVDEMKLMGLFGMLVPEEFGEKRVVAVPVALPVKRDEQQVRALELIKDPVGSLCLGDGVAKRTAQPRQDRRPKQERLQLGHLARENLSGQVVDDVPIVAGERLDHAARIRPPAQG